DNDIYLINLSNPNELQARNLTDTPDINEDNPAWSPDGSRLAYEGAGEGLQLIYVNEIDAAPGSAQVVGQGFAPAWSADGQNLVFLADRGQNSVLLSGRIGAWESSVQALALGSFGYNIDWSSANLPEALQGTMATARSEPIGPAYEEGIAPDAGTTDPAFRLRVLEDVDVEGQFLTDAVDGSFNALRAAVERRAGWDFLGELDHAFWAIDRPVEAGESRQNWHKAGRAFAILDTYNQGDTPDIEVVPNQSGPDRYWDVYVRAAVQDGSLGRPLTERPWDFYARATDRDAYENGGRFKDEIPSGYYINFTQLARIYGWEPTPSDPSWYYNWNGILYWQYVKRDNLDWIQAMRQIYTADRLEEELGVIFVQPTQVGP
ncbi:MAG: hypothetical protein GYB64_16315, partial [Chloroflexi bacterium]|nr:hypothetical protein [Chloroflexota bacterium]